MIPACDIGIRSLDLHNPDILTICQLVLDFALIAFIFILHRRISALNPRKLEHLLDALKKGERLCNELQKNLEEKSNITSAINRKLDELVRTGNSPVSMGRNSGTEKKHEVLKLWKKGNKPPEIAEQTGISLGEVELIISLAASDST